MSENQQALYSLVEDVGGLKRDVQHMSRTQETQWKKIDLLVDEVRRCSEKIDRTVALEERVDKAEAGVTDYFKTKSRVGGWIIGLGVGTGTIASTATAWLAKIFGNTPPPSP